MALIGNQSLARRMSATWEIFLRVVTFRVSVCVGCCLKSELKLWHSQTAATRKLNLSQDPAGPILSHGSLCFGSGHNTALVQYTLVTATHKDLTYPGLGLTA